MNQLLTKLKTVAVPFVFPARGLNRYRGSHSAERHLGRHRDVAGGAQADCGAIAGHGSADVELQPAGIETRLGLVAGQGDDRIPFDFLTFYSPTLRLPSAQFVCEPNQVGTHGGITGIFHELPSIFQQSRITDGL